MNKEELQSALGEAQERIRFLEEQKVNHIRAIENLIVERDDFRDASKSVETRHDRLQVEVGDLRVELYKQQNAVRMLESKLVDLDKDYRRERMLVNVLMELPRDT
jgi:hypothetical protein